jgi:hypothetical protein
MQHLKTPKPATARHGEPVSNGEWLGGPLNRPDTPKASEPQAPDNRGESDLEYFNARPNVDERVRLPFANEFAPELLKPGAFVHVLLIRNSDGSPGTRARAIFYSDIEGGTA